MLKLKTYPAIFTSLILVPLLLAAPASAEDDPLDQTLDGDLPIIRGVQQVLTQGHVDMGPKFDEGAWHFLIHDDAARADASAQSVWRYPDETVFQVGDSAILTVPDDPAYAFVGAEAGRDVWVVPQTQNPEVVWVGWNTQDPEVMQEIDRGVTLSLTGVQGPGIMTTYLQSGTFGEPELLWDSRVSEPQPLWVDVNTHTHANWVFTEPGVYLIQLEAAAELIDGSTVSDTQEIRFAVGGETSPDEAFAANWGNTQENPETTPTETENADIVQQAETPLENTAEFPTILVIVIIGAALAIIAAVAALTILSQRAKRQALAAGGNTDNSKISE